MNRPPPKPKINTKSKSNRKTQEKSIKKQRQNILADIEFPLKRKGEKYISKRPVGLKQGKQNKRHEKALWNKKQH